MSNRIYKIIIVILLINILFLISLLFISDSVFNRKTDDKNSSSLTANSESYRSIELNFVGDIFLDRSIETFTKKFGFDFMLGRIKNQLSDADITFANLEGPASFLGTPYHNKPPIVTFRADPSMLLMLKYAGVDIVSLANNHANDHYADALIETMRMLDVLEIKSFGAGRYLYQARKPAIIKEKGYTLAFLGYAEPIWSVVQASDTEAGVVHLDKAVILEDIEYTKKFHQPDFLFISVHWGEEYIHYPRKKDIKLAHDLIDAGADFIIGHHPHVLQGVELYKKGVILYSLGNFLFDMHEVPKRESMIFKVKIIGNNVETLKVLPVMIDADRFFAYPADKEGSKKIIDNLSEYSMQFKTEIFNLNNVGFIKVNNIK
ncbi:MAG: CapA family protein [Spirochaetes bacterium]|nr:CapA family protein [Spirochaetota bacterium]